MIPVWLSIISLSNSNKSCIIFQIEQVKDFLKKRKDERYEELQKGVLLSETFAQIEENDLIK